MSSKRSKELEKSIREAGKTRRGEAKPSRVFRHAEAEALWDQTLAVSAEAVDKLAEQALKEHRAGRTRKMGFDEL
jgi:hypothetical protein